MVGGETGANPFFFLTGGEIFVLGADRGGGGLKAIGNGQGCLSYF